MIEQCASWVRAADATVRFLKTVPSHAIKAGLWALFTAACAFSTTAAAGLGCDSETRKKAREHSFFWATYIDEDTSLPEEYCFGFTRFPSKDVAPVNANEHMRSFGFDDFLTLTGRIQVATGIDLWAGQSHPIVLHLLDGGAFAKQVRRYGLEDRNGRQCFSANTHDIATNYLDVSHIFVSRDIAFEHERMRCLTHHLLQALGLRGEHPNIGDSALNPELRGVTQPTLIDMINLRALYDDRLDVQKSFKAQARTVGQVVCDATAHMTELGLR